MGGASAPCEVPVFEEDNAAMANGTDGDDAGHNPIQRFSQHGDSNGNWSTT